MSLSVRLQHKFNAFELDVAFEASRGITVLFGRSGSGKTTVVNALAGLLHADAGRITLDGRVIFDSTSRIDLPTHARRIGYIFQEGRLFPHMTVRQNLKYGRWFAGLKGSGHNMPLIVEMLGIGHLLDRRPAALSGGEKQRVAIGRALLADPRLVLADEPLAALDEPRKAEIMPYFERLRDELDVPIVYVSHAGAEVARLASTVVVLDNGRVLRAGDAAEILSDPSVTPLGPSAAGAMIEARVFKHHPDGISEVIAGGLTLLLPRIDAAPGASLRLRIEAQDVMLATSRPEGISALNVLPARIATLRMGDGPGALVQVQAGGNLLLARVTRRSVAALDLCEGKELYAVLKAVSIPRGAIGDAGTGRG